MKFFQKSKFQVGVKGIILKKIQNYVIMKIPPDWKYEK